MDQMQEVDDRPVAVRAVIGEHILESFAVTAKGSEWIAKADGPIGARDEAAAGEIWCPPEGGLDYPRQAVCLAGYRLVSEGLGLDPGLGEAGEQVALADEAEIERLDGFAVGLQRAAEALDVGVLGFALAIEEGLQRGSCQPGLVEHALLLWRAGEAAQLADELANRPLATMILIAADMGGDVAFQPCEVVPVGRGRIAGSPFFPSRHRGCAVDMDRAVPLDADP